MRVVDWSWPTVGAAFIDPGMLLLELLSAGHSPAEAEKWVKGCAAWRDTDPRAIDVFVSATVRQHAHFVTRRPDETWLKTMLAAAEAWAEHRGVRW